MTGVIRGHRNESPPSIGGDTAPPVTPHAERRQVTALFCDLVDSVALTLRLDPEDMMRVVDIYLAACDDIIAEFGGNVLQYMGDGVLAYFGYPRANEDDAANAIRAAIGIRDAVGRLDLPPGVELRTRIGVATGLVVVSDLIGHREARGGGIIGETPNLAARLQSVADPDTVLVADATKRIAGAQFVYRDIGDVSLKSFPAPVRAYEALEAPPVTSRYLARGRGEATPLLGRDHELARMLGLWDEARRGRGQAVLLRGEPGIGKSRLVEELRRGVAGTSLVQLAWYCDPNSGDSALHPIARQLARAAGFERGDGADARRARLNELLAGDGATDPLGNAVIADLLGLPPEPGSPAARLTPDRRKAVTLETLSALLDQTAGRRPALLVVEDLHWSDSTTLELLDRVLARAGHRQWMILLTARPEFERRWPAGTEVTTIDLPRLTHGNAERICRHLGADSLLSADIVAGIVARCDGVPLFVEEMTKSVLESMADAPALGGVPTATIPATVRDSLVARLDRLGEARRIACLGATIGRRFSFELLAAVADRPEAALRQELRELTRSGLVERSGVPPASSYLFRHALIRDAAYDTLLRRDRETLHGRIATVLRDRFPDTREAEPELLAYHFTESGAIAEAIPLWALAGRRAAGRAAHLEAVGHLRTAIDLLRRQPANAERPAEELRLLTGLAVSLAATRGFVAPEVGEALAEARAICDGLGDIPAALFGVLRGISNLEAQSGAVAGAERTTRRMVTIGEHTGSPAHRIEAAAAVGYVLFLKGDLAEAQWHLELAERLYRENDGARLTWFGLQDPLILALSALLFVRYAMGDDTDPISRQLSEHARTVGQTFNLIFALGHLAHFENRRENYVRARELAEETGAICDTHGFALWRAIAAVNKAICNGHLGGPEDAMKAADTCADVLGRIGMAANRGRYLGEIAWLRAAAGDLLAARATIDAAILDARESGEHYSLSPLLRRRAEILARIPGADPATVTAALRDAIAVAKAQGATGFARQAAALLPGERTREPALPDIPPP